MTSNDFRTPGQFLRHLMEERGWSGRTLAIVLDVEHSLITRLLTDERPVDASRALELAEIFEVPAERFVELQRSYDLAKARLVKRPDHGRLTRAHLFGRLPVAEMITRGWLNVDGIRDVPKIEAELAKFFGVATPDEIEILPHVAKKTDVGDEVTPTQLAWLYRARAIASEMLAARYSPALVRAAIPKLRSLLFSPEEARKVPRILSECGIRFVIVESLKSAKIDGVCFWLNESSPVVGMSLRYDRMDNFWFVLRHELEHVLRQDGVHSPVLDAELERERAGTGSGIAEEERVANEAAADFCVPAVQLERFVARKAPIFAQRDILGFANTIKVHPALIAGQLQNYTKRYDRFRDHLVKIRELVAPSAVVDGWGDVYPVGD